MEIVDFAKNWIRAHRNFVVYFLICCFITVLDIVVSYVVERALLAATSRAALASQIGNISGVVTGFTVQYIQCTRSVYAGSNWRTFALFLGTWFIGLAFAQAIIYVTRSLIFKDAEGMVYFLIGKFFSIALPFFLTYYLRKITIPARKEDGEKDMK